VNWLGTLVESNRSLETWPKADRRQIRRSKVGMTFRITFDDLSLKPMTGRTRDFSRTGMYFVALPGNFRRGLRVRVELCRQSQPDDLWCIEGKIARVTKLPNSLYGIGVEFLHKYKP